MLGQLFASIQFTKLLEEDLFAWGGGQEETKQRGEAGDSKSRGCSGGAQGGARAWAGALLSPVRSACWTLTARRLHLPPHLPVCRAGPWRPLVPAWFAAAQLGNSCLCEGRFCPISPALLGLLPTRDKGGWPCKRQGPQGSLTNGPWELEVYSNHGTARGAPRGWKGLVGWWILADAGRRQDGEGNAGLWQPKSGGRQGHLFTFLN